MVQFGVGLGEFREDLLRELLAEFNAPLVVAVDVPDNALREDLVFVHGDEGAERFRRNVVHHDGVGRLVAFEHLVRSEECDFLFALAILAEFFLSLGERLAVHQCFGLCKEVGEQLLVVIANLVVAVGRGDEVARNHLGALVELHVVFETDAESNGKISLGVPRTARAGRAILQGVPCVPAARPHRSCNGTTVPPQGGTIPNVNTSL